MTGRVVVVGSLNLDSTARVARLPTAGETVHSAPAVLSPGGKGANQAVAASLLGARVAILGAVGDDDAGRILTNAADRAGVDVSGVRVSPAATGRATILVDDDAENMIIVDGAANTLLDPQHIRDDLSAADVVVTGNEVSDAVVRAAVAGAAALGALVVHNPSPFRPLPEGMPCPAVIVVNEHEHALWSTQGVDVLDEDVVVVTRGASGALVIEGGVATPVAAVAVEAVDTSGCGDAFLGALAAGIAAGRSVLEAAQYAVTVGAFAATRAGTQSSYPTAADIREWAASQPV